jgi:hypothetical protein
VWLGLALSCLLLASTSTSLAASKKKRTPPNYDGRGGAPQAPARKALWVPRVLLAPAYFVTEFLIRRPLGFAISSAERAKLPQALYNFLMVGPTNVGVVPFFLVDFGFEPSLGLYAYWDDVGFKGHQLRLRGSTWGPHWLSGTATERFHPARNLELALSSTATRRPDYAFYGLGPKARENALVRYGGDSVDASFLSHYDFAGRSFFELGVGYRGVTFKDTDYQDNSLVDAVRAGRLAQPAGFNEGFRAGVARARVALDSRGHTRTNTGVRFELAAEGGASRNYAATEAGATPGWQRYRGTLGGFFGFKHGGRLVSLDVSAQLAEPLGSRYVPFSELAALGGSVYLSGFRSGRLRDRSSVAISTRYSWPIWMWLRGSLQGGVGNVFGARFEGLDPRLFRGSIAMGLEGYTSEDSVLEALVGVGTETFESGAALNSARVIVGARRGF